MPCGYRTSPVIERLRGCPTGAAYETLCQWHTNAEMASVLATGLVTMETRDDADPRRHFKAIWFQLVTP